MKKYYVPFARFPLRNVACPRFLSRCFQTSSISTISRIFDIPTKLNTSLIGPLKQTAKRIDPDSSNALHNLMIRLAKQPSTNLICLISRINESKSKVKRFANSTSISFTSPAPSGYEDQTTVSCCPFLRNEKYLKSEVISESHSRRQPESGTKLKQYVASSDY